MMVGTIPINTKAGRKHKPSGAADELREQRRASARERARSVGVKTAAPLGLCFLPAFVLIGIVPTIISAFQGISW